MAGLGKGLASLISGRATNKKGNDAGLVQNIDVAMLQAGKYQPRTHFDKTELESLAESIKENGIVQPILARQDGVRYEIIAGERRWRAAQIAGLLNVPVIVREITDAKALEIGIIENVQREDLNPIEEAMSFQRLIGEFSYTQEQLAGAMSKSRSRITNSLRLLKLPESVRQMLGDGVITAGHGRALLGAKKPETLAKTVISKKLSVRDVENIVRQEGEKKLDSRTRNATKTLRNLSSLAKELSRQTDLDISVKVPAKSQQNNSGKLIISYNSLEEFNAIVQKLKK